MEAAGLVASPQIRNQGTLGGNVSQDTRCWYYRSGWTCYRAGGNICYADTPTAINREHAIFDANRCVAVNPSDTAPALVALDAQMVIRTSERRARRRRGRLLHRTGHRHHAHDGAAAGRAADGDPDSGHVGGRAVLLREGPRPPGVGLPAGERRGGDEGVQRHHSELAHRRQCRGRASDAAEGGRRRGRRQAAERRDGQDGGRAGGAGRPAARAQRLQDPADEKPGEARHQGRGQA